MIVLDTETTGLDADSCSLLSIGAVELENSENQFYGECRMWEGAAINEKSLAMNGFSRNEITDEDKQSPAELLRAFFV